MARKPKTQSSPDLAAAVPAPKPAAPDETSAPARRGRKPKAPAPTLLPTGGTGDPTADAVESDVAEAAPTKAPGRRGLGRKQKQAAGAEVTTVPLDTAGGQPSAEADPSTAGPEQAQAEEDALVAEKPVPPDAAGIGDAGQSGAHIDMAAPGATPSVTRPAKAARAAPAARWDRATDAVEFDWAAIERVAAQGGPNQGVAKLLVAARAEGAGSRWPF